MKRGWAWFFGFVGLWVLVGCGGESPSTGGSGGVREPVASGGAVSLDKNDYPVFPDADAGADPAVTAEEGGRGFTGEGWTTNTDFDLIGDPRALKGGMFREYQPSFPGTLRIHGPESNTVLNSMIGGMVYEALLSLHPTTLEYIPALATHWQVSEDKLTFRYRLDPNARWSDGEPVVADDVVATWSFLMDPGLQDPMGSVVWSKFEKPVAESKYIVRVTCAQENWRNFLYFSASMPIFPSHILKDVNGETYVKEYNFKLLPGTGSYVVNEEDVQKGQSIRLRRRPGYWGESQRRNIGTGNFDVVEEVVVRDQNLAFEMFKRGDLDFFYINRSRVWVEEMNFDRVQRGLIQKRRVFNQNPQGIQGFAFNMRRPPYDDLRVRKALTALYNRELMIEKLFYNQYIPQNSYYAGSVYENPNNPKNPYDPQEALRLLAEAGWTGHDNQGRLVRDGKPFEIELLYADENSETYLTVFQEDLRKVGIGLSLRLVTPETLFSLVMERRFDLVSMAWGGLVFPNPETSYLSSLADVDNTNNIAGVKNARIDELCKAYDVMFDMKDRIEAIQEIDGILANMYPYILAWTAPFQRITYWNKFGHPEGYLTRTGDYRDVVSLFWIDPEKRDQLEAAMKDDSIQLPVGETEVHPWEGLGTPELQ